MKKRLLSVMLIVALCLGMSMTANAAPQITPEEQPPADLTKEELQLFRHSSCKSITICPVSYTHLDVYKRQVYQAVFHRPAVEGGTLRVWTEGSDKKDVTYTNGKYVEEVPEGTTLYFEIEIKGNYLVDSVKDQNGAEIAPTNVSGNVSSYKMVIKENKELTIMYKDCLLYTSRCV